MKKKIFSFQNPFQHLLLCFCLCHKYYEYIMTLSLLHFLNRFSNWTFKCKPFSCNIHKEWKATIVIIFWKHERRRKRMQKERENVCQVGLKLEIKKCNNKGVKKIMNLVRVIITVVIGFNFTFYNHNERFKQQFFFLVFT